MADRNTRTYLSLRDSYRLMSWMQNLPTEQREVSNATMAELAREALGLTLTQHNVKGAREGLGWPAFGGTKKRSKKSELGLFTEQQLTELADRVTTLEGQLERLLTALGETAGTNHKEAS